MNAWQGIIYKSRNILDYCLKNLFIFAVKGQIEITIHPKTSCLFYDFDMTIILVDTLT